MTGPAFAGSFFDPLPTGADAYLLSDILHDRDDDHARAILARCRDAAAPNAAVVVIESAGVDGVDTACDLFLPRCFGGRQASVPELTASAADRGLRLRSRQPTGEPPWSSCWPQASSSRSVRGIA